MTHRYDFDDAFQSPDTTTSTDSIDYSVALTTEYVNLKRSRSRDRSLTAYTKYITNQLSAARTFHQFKLRAKTELLRLGIEHWEYVKTDSPLHISLNTDFGGLLKNLKPALSNTINLNEFSCAIVKLNDCKITPIKIHRPCSNGAILIATNRNRIRPSKERQTIDYVKIIILGQTLEFVDCNKFNKQLMSAFPHPEEIRDSRPIKLLIKMAKADLRIEQAASELCMATSTANNMLAKLRRDLKCRTNHTAFLKAIELGYISL